MQSPRQVSLHAAGEDQILTIPHEFMLSGTEVLLHKEGDRLIEQGLAQGLVDMQACQWSNQHFPAV